MAAEMPCQYSTALPDAPPDEPWRSNPPWPRLDTCKRSAGSAPVHTDQETTQLRISMNAMPVEVQSLTESFA